MKCNNFREHLLDLMAGEPGPGELRDHLNACASCAAELVSMRQTMALLDEWKPPADTSPYFMTRLRARLHEEQARPVGWLSWLRKPALAISMAVLMIASITLLQRGGPTEPSNGHSSVAMTPGTAVGDLQYLDRNHELLADFDMLDELEAAQTVEN
jgi:hypothetical protein